MEPTPQQFIVHCAACRKQLGSVSNQGWLWTRGPARLVNRKRFITSLPCDGDVSNLPEHAAPADDFRMRSVERSRGEPEYRIWEYPYTCDADACLEALGPEWGPKDVGPPFTLMPAGRVLS
jgi:hypothetical protein